MAVREIPVEERRQLLAVGDQIEANFDATANEKKIKEIARIVRDFGDLTHVTPNVEHYQNIRERANSRTTWFKQFKDVVDTSLEWLENRGRMYGQKQEQVLRALYNLSGGYLYKSGDISLTRHTRASNFLLKRNAAARPD